MYKLHSVSTARTPYLPLDVLTEGFSSPVLLTPVQITHQSNAHSKFDSPHLSIHSSWSPPILPALVVGHREGVCVAAMSVAKSGHPSRCQFFNKLHV